MSPIGMGCMAFSHGYGEVPTEDYGIEAIHRAYDYGCTFFDTAEGYGGQQFYPGHNEQLLGKAVTPFREKWGWPRSSCLWERYARRGRRWSPSSAATLSSR